MKFRTYCSIEVWSPGLSLGPLFSFSSTKNKFTAIRCAAIGIIQGNNPDPYTSACAAFCYGDELVGSSIDDDQGTEECSGMGCCQTSIPANLTDLRIGFLNHVVYSIPGVKKASPCAYAFVVEYTFVFNSSYAMSRNLMEEESKLPFVLDWSVGNRTCGEARMNSSSYACRASNSQCINTPNGRGYLCNCSQGYYGNPYLDRGCQDINECEKPSKYPCNGKCKNTIGGYSCSCPAGTMSKDPKKAPCNPIPFVFIGIVVVYVITGQ